MEGFLPAIEHLASPGPIALLMLGTGLGIIVGAVPGMTGAMLISLSLPLTFSMHYLDAMVLLVAMYVGSISGGLITATLLRMPGTPASIMTTLDGYPMAQSGRPGRALGLGISASLVGGLVSWGFLVMLARPIAAAATRLSGYDYFALVLVALVLIASVSGKSLAKGMFAGALGMLATVPGVSPADGQPRWTFGYTELNEGLDLLPVLIGLFAVGQIIDDVVRIEQPTQRIEMDRRGMFLSLADWGRQAVNLLRSSLIGTWVGILPGIGANIGSVMAYSAARSLSKNPDEFGTGAEEGIVASEAANNATVGGALIPLVAMGIPGSVIDAILLAALVLHGLQPGPRLFEDNPDVVYTIMVAVLVANLFMAFFMFATVGWLSRLMQVPRALLIPVILVFCVVGTYSLANRMFDVWVMLAFGLIGFAMDRTKMPLAPFVIGFVLAPIAETNLGKGMQAHQGDLTPLVKEPVSCTLLIVAAALLAWPFYQQWRGGRASKRDA